MIPCGVCGEPREVGKNCVACNKRRVYEWRLANPEKWRAIQNKSRRKKRNYSRERWTALERMMKARGLR